MALHKDEVLNSLAATANVAQFVSFRPSSKGDMSQSYCRVAGYPENHRFVDVKEAVAALLAASSDKMVNVRSYEPSSPRSREFVYGLETVESVLEIISRLSTENLHLIVNETIDIHDGGVSGVLQGQLIEFAPDDTPRCVEKPGIASLPMHMGERILHTVYGFSHCYRWLHAWHLSTYNLGNRVQTQTPSRSGSFYRRNRGVQLSSKASISSASSISSGAIKSSVSWYPSR